MEAQRAGGRPRSEGEGEAELNTKRVPKSLATCTWSLTSEAYWEMGIRAWSSSISSTRSPCTRKQGI